MLIIKSKNAHEFSNEIEEEEQEIISSDKQIKDMIKKDTEKDYIEL
jgi:hypothetical protein